MQAVIVLVFLTGYNGCPETPTLVLHPLRSSPVDLRQRAMGSTSVPSQLHNLYRTSKSPERFGPAFEGFYNSAEYEQITDGLDDRELGRFVDLLDRVRYPL